MNKGDTVTVWGVGEGASPAKNGFGVSINVEVVSETYLSDQTTGYNDNGP
jgi:hypothetical protein